jgi:hypothetical protein
LSFCIDRRNYCMLLPSVCYCSHSITLLCSVNLMTSGILPSTGIALIGYYRWLLSPREFWLPYFELENSYIVTVTSVVLPLQSQQFIVFL